MNFYKLDEVPITRDDTVFKESPTVNAIAAFFLFAIAIAALVAGIEKWPHGKSPTTFFYFTAVLCTLIGLLPLSFFRASLKPSNWLLRCQLSGFIIKYRGYENWKLPADTLQAVGFDYGEIAWAKIVKERRTEPSSDPKYNKETVWLTFIELGLAKPDTAELEANLQAERNLRPNGRMVVLDFPVQVRPGGVVQICWKGGIRPTARKALAVLGQRVQILELEHRVTDLTHSWKSNPDDEKAKILALAQSGDEISAVQLAQQVYGYSLTQAHEFVAKLTGKKAD